MELINFDSYQFQINDLYQYTLICNLGLTLVQFNQLDIRCLEGVRILIYLTLKQPIMIGNEQYCFKILKCIRLRKDKEESTYFNIFNSPSGRLMQFAFESLSLAIPIHANPYGFKNFANAFLNVFLGVYQILK
ncbi:hypothetical protein pb186bvf_001649 [Paramecium bursaria]